MRLGTLARDGLKAFGQLERFLALVSLFTPLLLIGFNTWTVNGTISSYYSMTENVVFYVPLTVAAMLFVVNGVIRNKHWYNTVLGAALLGVIVFNTDTFHPIHLLFVAVFFGGNAIVMLVSKAAISLKVAIVVAAAIIFTGAGVGNGHWIFWLEWASLAIIAAHYVLDSLSGRFVDLYHAPARSAAA